ncbi:hypothetical protein SAMN05519104_8005 [Rhizobiales bacterium GAS188]|nr:hypothetical protein SAMN05519104_8005 [Rhizobiales bacterium GAS188]
MIAAHLGGRGASGKHDLFEAFAGHRMVPPPSELLIYFPAARARIAKTRATLRSEYACFSTS